MKYLFHTLKCSLPCCNILLYGTDGFSSPPKEGVLGILLVLDRVSTREPWVQL
jgi:hypothetical protein